VVTLSVEVTSKSTLHVCNICTPAVSASLHPCVCKHKQVRISYGPRNPSNPDNSQSLRLYCTLHNIKEGRGRREQALDHLRAWYCDWWGKYISIGNYNLVSKLFVNFWELRKLQFTSTENKKISSMYSPSDRQEAML